MSSVMEMLLRNLRNRVIVEPQYKQKFDLWLFDCVDRSNVNVLTKLHIRSTKTKYVLTVIHYNSTEILYEVKKKDLI